MSAVSVATQRVWVPTKSPRLANTIAAPAQELTQLVYDHRTFTLTRRAIAHRHLLGHNLTLLDLLQTLAVSFTLAVNKVNVVRSGTVQRAKVRVVTFRERHMTSSNLTPATNDVAIDETPVRTERRGHTMIVTLNRPEARNAVNLAVAVNLGDALEEADRDQDVRALVLTGAGEESFCAGADLKAVARGEDIVPTDEHRRSWGFAGYVSHPVSKPTIAAVNGFALGGGTEIALASDLVVATEGASFGLPEVKRGIYAGAGGVFRLPAQLPKKVAMEMVLTGDPMTAHRAVEFGLVNTIVPQSRVLDAALELAERICQNAPLAVQASKRIANGIIDGRTPAEEAPWHLSAQEGAALMRTHDAKEGPRAFAEKRPPDWQAR